RCRGTGWRISLADRPPRPPQETSRRLNHESAPRRVWPLLLTKEDLGLPGIVRDGERLVGTRARQLVPLVRGIEEVRDRAEVDPVGADGKGLLTVRDRGNVQRRDDLVRSLDAAERQVGRIVGEPREAAVGQRGMAL